MLKKILFIFSLLFIVLINFTSAGSFSCYQESANITTICGGLNTGVYWNITPWPNVSYIYDGNWSTSGGSDTTTKDLFINYTKPSNALNSSLWQVKDGNGMINLSLPNDCFNQNILSFKVTATSRGPGLSPFAWWYCYNTSSSLWLQLRTTNGASDSVYEEAMEWVISDSIAPNVTLNSPTNYYNSSNSTITFNGTILDDYNLVNVSLLINGIINQTNSSGLNNIDYTFNLTLPDGKYNWSIRATDLANNINLTSNRTLTIDTLPPVISILFPLPQNYNYNASINLNYSSIDAGVGTISSCNYSIINKTGGGIVIPNTNLPNCLNSTFNLSNIDNDYNLTLCSNDTLNNWNCSLVTFGIRMQPPSVVLNSPSANQYFNNGTKIYLNFTASRSIGIDTAQLYVDGILNYTWIRPTNFTMNWTTLNFSEGVHNFNVKVNDTLNNIGWALSNITFYVDYTAPNVTINSISTTSGSKTVTFSANTLDNLGINICKYSVYNSLDLIDAGKENITFTCQSQTAFIVSAYDTYNLKVYASDLAGWENSTSQSFTVSDLIPPVIYGGGGCTYNWVCSEWYPADCPQESVQKRVCVNRGTCTNNDTMPDLNRSCVPISEPLFDINVKTPANYKSIFPGGIFKTSVSLINVGKVITMDVFLKYWITDGTNNIISEIQETRAINKKDSFDVIFNIPHNISLGDYVIHAEADYYTNRTAMAGDSFQVVENKFLPLIISTVFVLVIMIISVSIILVLIALISKVRPIMEEQYISV